jgi:ribosome silencing factor RsfS/YbeB/iojap
MSGQEQNHLEALTAAVVEAVEDKKALDVAVVDVRGNCAFADRFIIATGRTDRQLKAIAESAAEAAHRFGLPARIEGLDAMEWLLLDLGDIVLHVMLPEVRESVQLERLWGHVPAGRNVAEGASG